MSPDWQGLANEFEMRVLPDGNRLVLHHGIVIGRLRRTGNAREWVLDWRGEWTPTGASLFSDVGEHAEGWAAEELARLYGREYEAHDREGGRPGPSA